MRRGLKVLLAAMALGVPGAATAAPVPYTALDPTAYQSFVGNWSPDTGPLCAVIGSQAQWDKVMHPAPLMGKTPVFGPRTSTWDGHVVLLIAKVMPGGGMGSAFKPLSVERTGDTLDVSYRYVMPHVASYQIKGYMALEVAKPAVESVVFTENGKAVCSLKPGAGVWLSPAPPKP
jgi:hypothetical protein